MARNTGRGSRYAAGIPWSSTKARGGAFLGVRGRAAAHELRCAECRVSWRSWRRRVLGDKRGMNPARYG